MKKKSLISLIVLIGAVAISVLVLISINSEKKREAARNSLMNSIKIEADSLNWSKPNIFYGSGNKTLSNISAQPPYRIRYVFSDKGKTGLKIYKENDGTMDTSPLLIGTKENGGVSLQYAALDSSNLVIDCDGVWAISIESLHNRTYPSNALKSRIDSMITNRIVDSIIVKNAIDSLSHQKAIQLHNSLKPNYSDLITPRDSIKKSSMKWNLVSSDRGSYNFESATFHLPSCKVKIFGGLCPLDGMSVRGGIKLKSEDGKRSYTVVDFSWYMIGDNWEANTVTFNVPEGYYYINIGSDGIWEYEVHALY